MSALFVTPLN